MQQQPLANEIALVTGASRGIGQAIALALGLNGAIVIGTATSSNGAENVSKYLNNNDINGEGMVLNVTDQDSVDGLFSSLKQGVGAPTILVNNAAITRDNLLLRMKDEQWDEVMDTNLKSLLRLSKACIKSMNKARKGRIINISSVVASTGNPGQANYSAAKAGVLGFTKSLAREIGSRHVTVNAVAPGFIVTDMTRDLPEAQKQALLAQIPLGRLGTPEEVAAAVLFLTLPSSGYITGTTLHVNGGMYMN